MSISCLHHLLTSFTTCLLAFYMFLPRLSRLKPLLLPILLFLNMIFTDFLHCHMIQILIQLFHIFIANSRNFVSRISSSFKQLKTDLFLEIGPALSKIACYPSFYPWISSFSAPNLNEYLEYCLNLFTSQHLNILDVPLIFSMYSGNHTLFLFWNAYFSQCFYC